MSCPSESELALYAAGRAPRDDRLRVEEHMAACDECRALVSLLARATSALGGSSPTALALVTPRGDAPPHVGERAAGDVLGGKYRVERVLGEGGMGVVLEVTHLGLDQRMALKMLHRDVGRAPGATERFAREARACAKIKSEHVVRVFDTGVFETGEPYIVMELLAGHDLRAWVQPGLPIERAALAIVQACDALDEAHRAGFVHRDIKPGNLFATTDKGGRTIIKVLDFGISRLQGEESSALTSQGSTPGSPRYMSPEQLASPRDVDARTDVWALGVVLYELVTARAPFEGETLASLAASILTDAPRAPSELRRASPHEQGVLPELDAIILRCLEKHKERRFASVGALAAALAPLTNDEGRAIAERIARAPISIAPPSGTPVSGFERTTLVKPSRAPLWIALSAAGAIAGVIVTSLLHKTPPSAAASRETEAPLAPRAVETTITTASAAPVAAPRPSSSSNSSSSNEPARTKRATAMAPAPSAVASGAPSVAPSAAPSATATASSSMGAAPIVSGSALRDRK